MFLAVATRVSAWILADNSHATWHALERDDPAKLHDDSVAFPDANAG